VGDQATPQQRIEAECHRVGTDAVIARCLDLLAGGALDVAFVAVLGGEHARRLLRQELPEDQMYWLRVWAARGLLWAGPGDDSAALRSALQDRAWRVREMICKVAAKYRIADLLDDLGALADDPNLRVRRAAERAVVLTVDSLD